MSTEKEVRIKQKVDTKSNWSQQNAILLENEIGYEKNTGKYKIGDEQTSWSSLPYFVTGEQRANEQGVVFPVNDNNSAISEATLAIGQRAKAGNKAYHYCNIYYDANNNQAVFTLTEYNDNGFTEYWTPRDAEVFGVGAILSFTTDTAKYYNCLKVVSENNNKITVQSNNLIQPDFEFNQDYLKSEYDDGFDGNIIYIEGQTEGTVDLGIGAFAEGGSTKASEASCAFGPYAHSEGRNSKASGHYSHAEGRNTVASNVSAHAEGGNTTAFGRQSHAEGQATYAAGAYSHAEGDNTWVWAKGGHAEGSNTTITEDGSFGHVEGYKSEVAAEGGHAEGSSASWGQYSHAENHSTASGSYAHSEGYATRATGYAAHVEGMETVSGGLGSHVEGYQSSATSDAFAGHAEGKETVASGRYSHAEGDQSRASGESSHAEGFYAQATGHSGHAEGNTTRAQGFASHAEGLGTIARKSCCHAEGKYNIEDNPIGAALGNYIHIAGNGTSDTARSNAYTLDWNGNAWFAGDVTVGPNKEKLVTETIPDKAIKIIGEEVSFEEVYGFPFQLSNGAEYFRSIQTLDGSREVPIYRDTSDQGYYYCILDNIDEPQIVGYDGNKFAALFSQTTILSTNQTTIYLDINKEKRIKYTLTQFNVNSDDGTLMVSEQEVDRNISNLNANSTQRAFDYYALTSEGIYVRYKNSNNVYADAFIPLDTNVNTAYQISIEDELKFIDFWKGNGPFIDSSIISNLYTQPIDWVIMGTSTVPTYLVSCALDENNTIQCHKVQIKEIQSNTTHKALYITPEIVYITNIGYLHYQSGADNYTITNSSGAPTFGVDTPAYVNEQSTQIIQCGQTITDSYLGLNFLTLNVIDNYPANSLAVSDPFVTKNGILDGHWIDLNTFALQTRTINSYPYYTIFKLNSKW